MSVAIVASNDLTFFFSSSSSFSAAFRSFTADCGAMTTGVAIFFGLPGVPFGFGVPAAEFGVFGGLPRPLFGVGVAAGFATGVAFGVVAVFGGRPRGFGVPSAAGFLGGRPRGLLAGDDNWAVPALRFLSAVLFNVFTNEPSGASSSGKGTLATAASASKVFLFLLPGGRPRGIVGWRARDNLNKFSSSFTRNDPLFEVYASHYSFSVYTSPNSIVASTKSRSSLKHKVRSIFIFHDQITDQNCQRTRNIVMFGRTHGVGCSHGLLPRP